MAMHIGLIVRHLPLFVRFAPFAMVFIAMLTWAPRSHAAFPGDNGRLAITSDVDCDSELLNVVTLDPYAYDIEPTGGDFSAVGRGESPAWSPNGTRMAFEDFGTLYTVNADGSGSDPIGDGYVPAWSPDGQQIAYRTFSGAFADIHVMSADGSGDATLTTSSGEDTVPSWSPDGTKIAFASEREGNFEIYVMDADGGNQTRLTTNAGFDYYPNWSPDGSKIAFSRGAQIIVMSANGSGQTAIPSSEDGGGDPAWSPDGSRIAFNGALGIYAMNADGSDVTLVYSGCGFGPDWQPIPRGYVRPKGATPLRVPLVPAFKPCTSPNRTQGAPLSSPSCATPAPEATSAFIGIGDGNPAPAKSIGSVLVKALPGASGPPDDADVSIGVSITNVMNTSDRSDYTGELRLDLPLRITDRFNRPSPSDTGPGTVADTSFFATVPCAGTPDTTVGSTCALSATADALLPGTVREGGRAIWALGQVKLHDGGPDGDAETPADNELFAVQGVFAP
jgi:hypothetical protein